jgi:hypothetical protein
MHEPDFWIGDAELLELSIQGQRLIILDIAEAMRGLWHRWKPPAVAWTSRYFAPVTDRRAAQVAAEYAGSESVAQSRQY